MVYLPRLLKLLKYPVPVCPEVAHSTGRIRENFMYQNFWSQVVVVQKGEQEAEQQEGAVGRVEAIHARRPPTAAALAARATPLPPSLKSKQPGSAGR